VDKPARRIARGGTTTQPLEVSVKTVQRTWLAARAWLRKEIGGELA
jgi:hypothetical protein